MSRINVVNMNKYLLFHFFGKVNFNIINCLSLNNIDNLSINDTNISFYTSSCSFLILNTLYFIIVAFYLFITKSSIKFTNSFLHSNIKKQSSKNRNSFFFCCFISHSLQSFDSTTGTLTIVNETDFSNR